MSLDSYFKHIKTCLKMAIYFFQIMYKSTCYNICIREVILHLNFLYAVIHQLGEKDPALVLWSEFFRWSRHRLILNCGYGIGIADQKVTF